MAKQGSRSNSVNTEFTVTDQASNQAKKIGSSFSALKTIIAPVTAALVALGGRAVINNLLTLNNKFEQTRISLAGYLQALGSAGSYAQGLSIADKAMEKIRVASAALPGEAQDYINVFSAGMPVLQNAFRGNMNEMLTFSNRYTAVMSTLGVESAQAARDLNMMLDMTRGRVGMLSVSFTKLLPFISQVPEYASMTAEEFNKLTAEKRLEVLQKGFLGLTDMLDASASSFDAMSGALKSNIKEIARQASLPLFEAAKNSLAVMNNLLYDSNGELTKFGSGIVNVGQSIFTSITEKIQQAIEATERLYSKFQAITESPALKQLVSTIGTIGNMIGAIGGGLLGGITGKDSKTETEKGGYEGAGAATGVAGGLGLFTALIAIIKGVNPWLIVLGGVLSSLVGKTEPLQNIFTSLTKLLQTVVEAIQPLLAPLFQIFDAVADIIGELLPPLIDIITALVSIISALMPAVAGVIKIILAILIPVLTTVAKAISYVIQLILATLVPIINTFAQAIQFVVDTITEVIDYLKSTLQPIIDVIADAFRKLESAINSLINFIRRSLPQTEAWAGTHIRQGRSIARDPMQMPVQEATAPIAAKAPSPGSGAKTVQDFRFSRFEVTQKFAEGFDPDRIAIAFANDIAKLGEARLTSGFSNLYSVI